MSPWVAGVTFGLGVAVGLYWAHEADEALHLHITTALEAQQVERDVCREHLQEAVALLDVQQQVLERQLKVLSDVCPIVRRSVVPWPWCPPKGVEVVR